MATKDTHVKVWKVTVNNSGRSNMATVVGRYMTPEAAEKVAEAFRAVVYADPYNYYADTRINAARNGIDVATHANVCVTVDSTTYDYCLMSDAAIDIAREAGIPVQIVD